jgi:aldehyde dehydrogenase (NAD+)
MSGLVLEAGLLIGADEVSAAAGGQFVTWDPSTGTQVGLIAQGTAQDVDCAVRTAQDALAQTRDLRPVDRGRMLGRIARAIRERANELVDYDVRNSGLPRRMAIADVEVAARYFEYYAGAVDKHHGDSIPLGSEHVDYVQREPWGVCGVVTPFNVPMQLTARSLAPLLAMGNAAVVKPAEQAPLPVLRLARLMLDAGLPPGLVNVVPGAGAEAGEALVAHAGVQHLTFTGSVEVGRRIMRAASDNLTPVTLELGGKSPQVVFADADLDAATGAITQSALFTAGQVCSAGTRILVQEPAYDEVCARLHAIAQEMVVGLAADDPDMGPLISRRQQEAVCAAVDAAQEQGARRLPVAPLPPSLDGGFFVPPTVLVGVTPEMDIARQEVFGPVLAVMSFTDEADALRIANSTEFGLVAGVWSSALGPALRLARDIRAGQVFVNNYGVGGGVELPFGGFGNSGFGREKGLAALDEYSQIKNICVRIG